MRALLAIVLVTACAEARMDEGALDFPYDETPDGKTDVFGRKLAGVASDYQAAALDETALTTNMRARREAAWETVRKVLEPVPLLGLAEPAGEHPELELPGGEIPRVPRFETWYGIDDHKRLFQHLYEDLGPAGRAVRAPFDQTAVDDAFVWNAHALDRTSRWPLERYLAYVRALGLCPAGMPDDECARLVQSQFGGAVAGTPRILYSPAVVRHVLENYPRVLDCLAELDTLSLAATPAAGDNFSQCFDREFPVNGALVKAQWLRADFGKKVPAFDTGAEALAARLHGTANWGEDGDRTADPSPADVYTIRLKNGDTYRLVGLHIMTKELRHWQWVTLWWSDQPGSDFGADRPAAAWGVWRNYKMCVVDGYRELDAAPAAHYDGSLAGALAAIDAGAGGPTWCSNPYLEHGRGNARTNCIGCHQHGGSTVIRDVDADGTLDPLDLEAVITDEVHFPDTGRRQIRELFPADYLYSMNRVDDFAHMMRAEVSYFDGADDDAVRPRIERILALTGDSAAGGAHFQESCTPCHGPTGEGSGWAPNLYTRVPNRDDESLLQTLIAGKGDMPAWGEHFDDQGLADVLAYLRATFGSP